MQIHNSNSLEILILFRLRRKKIYFAILKFQQYYYIFIIHVKINYLVKIMN